MEINKVPASEIEDAITKFNSLSDKEKKTVADLIDLLYEKQEAN